MAQKHTMRILILDLLIRHIQMNVVFSEAKALGATLGTGNNFQKVGHRGAQISHITQVCENYSRWDGGITLSRQFVRAQCQSGRGHQPGVQSHKIW